MNQKNRGLLSPNLTLSSTSYSNPLRSGRRACAARGYSSLSQLPIGSTTRALYKCWPFGCRGDSVRCLNEEDLGELPEESVNMTPWNRLCVFSEKLSQNFAGVVLVSCSIALFFPAPFLSFTSDMVSIALAVSMLAMGCTLKLEDFAILAQSPFRIVAGVLLQYTVMPTTGFVISRFMHLSPPLAAGIILVSCCPGGVASNIVTYLAEGDVALSVAMTSVSTLLAVGLTPVLTALLIGTLVPVDGWALFLSTLQVILVPLIMGLLIKSLFPKTVDELQKISPLVAVTAVTCINCSITARNAAVIVQSGSTIFAAVATLHITGFTLGYFLAAALRFPQRSCTTISIEVGMQNSGLGAVLAMKHFGDPLSSTACVISACFHSIFGGLFASFVRHRNQQQQQHKS